MARKPHVAYFAGMEYVPMPYEDALIDFLKAAARSRADYLFISPIETGQNPQLSVLADPGVSLPGLVPLAHRMLDETHGFALYRREPTDAPVSIVEESLLVAIRRFASRRPGQPWPRTYLGGHLVTMGRYREALGPLAEAQRLDPGDALVARFQGVALAELGEYDRAAAAFERALSLPAGGAWERGYLGHIRLEQGRYAEARGELERALRVEPANRIYLAEYLEASALGGDWQQAVAAAEQLLRLVPGDATARLWGARAWLKLGRPDRARALAEGPVPPSGRDAPALGAFVDSLRKGAGDSPP